MARRTGRFYFGPQRIVVAVHAQAYQALHIAAGTAFMPQFLTGTGPKPHFLVAQGQLIGFAVHPCYHEHFATVNIGYHRRHQTAAFSKIRFRSFHCRRSRFNICNVLGTHAFSSHSITSSTHLLTHRYVSLFQRRFYIFDRHFTKVENRRRQRPGYLRLRKYIDKIIDATSTTAGNNGHIHCFL